MFGASGPPLSLAPIAVCPSAPNVSALNILQAQKSFCASIPADITPSWPLNLSQNKNPLFFSPIVQTRFCPALLTTKKSRFENYATGIKPQLDSLWENCILDAGITDL